MNEEIRKIINDLEFCSGALDYMLPPDYCELLFNYITNLQQENQRLKKTLHNINISDGVTTTPVLDLIKENQQLKEQYCERTDCSGRLGSSRKVEKYKQVLDEIREYIKELDDDTDNTIYDIDKNVRDDLLQILDKVKE